MHTNMCACAYVSCHVHIACLSVYTPPHTYTYKCIHLHIIPTVKMFAYTHVSAYV